MSKIDKISDVCLERFVLGELPDNEVKEIEQMIQNDDSVKKRIDDIKFSNREFIDKYPVEMFSNIVNNRIKQNSKSKKTKKSSFFLIKTLVPVLSSIILVSVFMFNKINLNKAGDNYIGIKGNSQEVFIFKKYDQQNLMLEKDSVVYQNDLIQLKYRSVENNYGIILSVDGNLNITRHFPASDLSEETLLIKGETVPLENSYLLDNAPEFEIFYFITNKNPIDILYIENRFNTYVKTERDLLHSNFKLTKSYSVTTFPLLKGKLK